MKKLALFLGMFSLVSTAHADVSGLGTEMQAFLRCKPAHMIPDAGVEVEMRQERVVAKATSLPPCVISVA